MLTMEFQGQDCPVAVDHQATVFRMAGVGHRDLVPRLIARVFASRLVHMLT